MTTQALSLKFSSGLPHRCHTVPKECCLHNAMDVCLTSGPASSLHIVATCRAEALLPTPSPPKSLIITCLTVVLALCDTCMFSKELNSKPTAFSSCLAYLVFSLALPALLSRVTVFCFRHAPYTCCRGCRQLVPVLQGFSLEDSGEQGDLQGREITCPLENLEGS